MLIHSLSNCRSANLFYYMKLLMIITPYLLLWLCGATLPVYISPLRDCCVLGVFECRSSFWLFFFISVFHFSNGHQQRTLLWVMAALFLFWWALNFKFFGRNFPIAVLSSASPKKKRNAKTNHFVRALFFPRSWTIDHTHAEHAHTHTHTQCNNTPPISLGNFRLLFF
jgi:hypothetical protein